MITTYTAPTPAAFAVARNAALKVGLPFEPVGLVSAEVTFQDAEKALSIVKEAGGRFSGTRRGRTMTRKEML